jgi:hypothetical protein
MGKVRIVKILSLPSDARERIMRENGNAVDGSYTRSCMDTEGGPANMIIFNAFEFF